MTVTARLVTVALLAEGVDRNQPFLGVAALFSVALLAEGVDRNLVFYYNGSHDTGRPPRGGRG